MQEKNRHITTNHHWSHELILKSTFWDFILKQMTLPFIAAQYSIKVDHDQLLAVDHNSRSWHGQFVYIKAISYLIILDSWPVCSAHAQVSRSAADLPVVTTTTFIPWSDVELILLTVLEVNFIVLCSWWWVRGKFCLLHGSPDLNQTKVYLIHIVFRRGTSV